MKFGQLLEDNMRNISLKKSYTKWGGESIPISFSKIANSTLSLGQWSKVLYSFFIVYQVGGYQNILKVSCRLLLFNSYKKFSKKRKEVWN